MGGPTEVVNDEGIRHTTGTPVAGNLMSYWRVSRVSLIEQINAKRSQGNSDSEETWFITRVRGGIEGIN
jgi:hypothetical protein